MPGISWATLQHFPLSSSVVSCYVVSRKHGLTTFIGAATETSEAVFHTTSPAIVYFYLLFAGLGLLSLSAAGSIWVGGGIAAGRSESTDE